MLRVSFSVEGAEAASSAVSLKLGVAVAPEVPVHAALVRCEARIEAARRGYTPGEQERLFDLFGEPARHARTLRPLPWTQTTLLVPSFHGRVLVDLTLPCGTDFDGAVAKYFEALDDGEVPLSLLFSGTVFHARDDGGLQVSPLPWTSEACGALPVSVYRDAYERHHGASALLPIPRALYERLRRYKKARGAATWAQAIDTLLDDHEAPR